MSLFGKKDSHGESREVVVLAPISGKVVDVSNVPDPTFAERLLGDGVAIEPSAGSVVSPISGSITAFPDSSHAFTVKDSHDLEILVHIGLETVSMGGKGFEAKTSVGATVNAGDSAIEVDLQSIRDLRNPTITPVVITSMHKVGKIEHLAMDQTVNAGDPILKIKLV